jgi:maltose-binding protein MalE
MESAKEGIPMPNIPAMAAVWNAMGSALSLSLTGKEEPKKALEHAKTQILSSVK